MTTTTMTATHTTLREKIRAEKLARESERSQYPGLLARAHAAGVAAAEACTPTPMQVIDYRTGATEIVSDGPCGFAWVSVKPATSRFARWALETGAARKDGYHGGITFWSPLRTQSYAKNTAYAYAFADVLRAAGIPRCFADGRLD